MMTLEYRSFVEDDRSYNGLITKTDHRLLIVKLNIIEKHEETSSKEIKPEFPIKGKKIVRNTGKVGCYLET